MRDHVFYTCVALCITLIITGIIGMGNSRGVTQTQKEAIEQGCAQYNPTTASFEWIEKEREE